MNGFFGRKVFDGSEPKQERFEFMQKTRLEPAQAEWLSPHLNAQPRSPTIPLKVLLVDDDASFGKIMLRSARLRGIDLTFCVAIDEVAKYSHETFDLALIDFHLGSVTGVEFSEYLTRYNFGALDTIIISHSQQNISQQWPINARRFLNKKIGPHQIFDSVCQTYKSSHPSTVTKLSA